MAEDEIVLDHYATQNLSDYKSVSYTSAQKDYCSYNRGAHAMIYTHTPKHCLILMTMRFDGFLGFPGGMADKGENIEESLQRELQEEIALNENIVKIESTDNLMVHINDKTKLALYFYAKQVTYQEFLKIRTGLLSAKDFGSETLGICFVPLHIGQDGVSGLPRFLSNQFIGNTVDQLLFALEELRLLPQDTIKQATDAYKKLVCS